MDQLHDKSDIASFICEAYGEPLPTISWYTSGALLVNGMKYIISNTLRSDHNFIAINSTLTIMNVQSSDVGTYTCNATNVVSTDISSGVLTVNGEFLL